MTVLGGMLEPSGEPDKELQDALKRLRQEIAELEQVNANLRIERDAADVLLGHALDLVNE